MQSRVLFGFLVLFLVLFFLPNHQIDLIETQSKPISGVSHAHINAVKEMVLVRQPRLAGCCGAPECS